MGVVAPCPLLPLEEGDPGSRGAPCWCRCTWCWWFWPLASAGPHIAVCPGRSFMLLLAGLMALAGAGGGGGMHVRCLEWQSLVQRNVGPNAQIPPKDLVPNSEIVAQEHAHAAVFGVRMVTVIPWRLCIPRALKTDTRKNVGPGKSTTAGVGALLLCQILQFQNSPIPKPPPPPPV